MYTPPSKNATLRAADASAEIDDPTSAKKLHV
jgi:hypothetical protein